MEPVMPMLARGSDHEIVLALNSGSSSVKFGVYEVGASSLAVPASGEFEGADTGRAVFDHIGEVVARVKAPAPTAIGHRVVHGGAQLRRHCLIDADVIGQLEAAIAFAPLHGPASLALIHDAADRYPELPQVACFDTAFHATMPEVAYTLPISRALRAEGLRRYGFHGLSCESIVHQFGGDVPDRMVIAHLGNGASVTAVKAGRSIDTSMGLTPSGGVIMGTRSGDLDPGVLVYLLREKGFDATSIETLVDHQSGLLGISGLSGDMRRLHEASASHPDAAIAVAMFCISVRKQIAAMIAVLDGIDALVFTGGIGENDALVRSAICEGLGWAGIGSSVKILPSQEDEQIARHTRDIVRASPSPVRVSRGPTGTSSHARV
jgi:acetate kinase